MTKSKGTQDYQLLDNGAIAISRNYTNLLEPYKKSQVPDYLDLVDHCLEMKRDRYETLMKSTERQFNTLVRRMDAAQKFLIIVLQGRDASGKSGTTERIIQALDYDPRIFLWVPIGAPTESERKHPYLWRFMTGERMPEHGQVRVFDRSWAERVLVEPVMHLTPQRDVQRAYAEIRAFEWLLQSQGAILTKFWLDITKAEQLKRFKARAQKKPWKLSPDDDEARKHWAAYTKAANEMFYRTSTQTAPWYLISSEDKCYSRITIMQIINQKLRDALRK